MPRVQNLNTKTKEGKELHCNYAEKKEDIEMKKFIPCPNPYQESSISNGLQNRRLLGYQQPYQQGFSIVSHEYHQIHQSQQLIQLNRNQSRSTSNLLSRGNQYQSQSFVSNFSSNSFQFAAAAPSSFYPPNSQSLVSNQPQQYPSMNFSLRPSQNLSSGSQKQKRQKFTSEEDDIIIGLVGDEKFPNWNEIATHIKGRTGRQCRERYQHYLSPNLSCEPWTLQEDRIVFKLYKMYGSKWALIAKHFNGRRTNNSIKNRWNNHIRFFKDSILNSEMKPVPSSNLKSSDDIKSTEQISTENSNSESKNEFGAFDLIQVTGQEPLSATPMTPEPQLPTFSFNSDNWNPFDQKGALSNSFSSGLLPTINLKDIANSSEKLTNSEPQKPNDKTNELSIFATEQSQVDFSSPICSKPDDKKEDSLNQNQNDDKSKSFDEQFLSYANGENPADPYGIDFDFLMF